MLLTKRPRTFRYTRRHKHCPKQDTTYLAKGLVSQAKIIFPLEGQDNRGAVFLGSSDRIHWLRLIHIENTKIVRFMQSLSVCALTKPRNFFGSLYLQIYNCCPWVVIGPPNPFIIWKCICNTLSEASFNTCHQPTCIRNNPKNQWKNPSPYLPLWLCIFLSRQFLYWNLWSFI